jgi:hypothetical protein
MLRSNAVMSSESTAISQSAERSVSLVATNACGNGDAKRQNDRVFPNLEKRTASRQPAGKQAPNYPCVGSGQNQLG